VRRLTRLLALALLVPLALAIGTTSGSVTASAALAAPAPRDLGLAAPESVGVSADRLRRLETGMKTIADEGRLSGIVTLLARRGKIVSFQAAGRKDVGRSDPMQKDSIFRIYSMTKPITGVAMMMLYEEGKWRLDDPVSRYIPEFASLKVHVGEEPDGRPKLEDARRSMTLRELMTHSAGLAYGLNERNAVDRLYRQSRVLNSDVSLQAMVDSLAKLPLLAQPGTRWYYSIGVDVQGYLVEKLSGQPFDQFLQKRIFEPLGMKDTSFFVTKDKLPRLALVHRENEAGGIEVQRDFGGDPTVKPAGPSGGGGLFSTAADYVRFTQMLLNGGQLDGVRLLAPRTVEMMRTNHLSKEALATAGAGIGWGMDFAVVMDAAAAGLPLADSSYYWAGAAGTWFWIDPKTDLTFIGMIQHFGRAVGEVQGVSRNLVYQSIVD
jgi:CubicO group peptidase (beta-lactamase class C family)